MIPSLGVEGFTLQKKWPGEKSEKSRKSEKSHFFVKKLIFGENDENDQILAFLRFRTPKTPKIP